MSLMPILFSDFWDDFGSSRGYGGWGWRPEDFFCDIPFVRESDTTVSRPPRRHGRRYRPYISSGQLEDRSKGASVVRADKDKFHVTLDVQHFAPEELTVKVIDDTVVVEGKHDEKRDDHGLVSRQFVRKYIIPNQCDIEQVQSNLSSDGILTITVPRKPAEPAETRERIIEIQRTERPAIQENNPSSEDQSASGKIKQSEKQPAAKKKIAAA